MLVYYVVYVVYTGVYTMLVGIYVDLSIIMKQILYQTIKPSEYIIIPMGFEHTARRSQCSSMLYYVRLMASPDAPDGNDMNRV